MKRSDSNFTACDGAYWDESACYRLSADEVDVIEAATEGLHKLCLRAAQRVVEDKLFDRFAIPASFADYVVASWPRAEPTLFGRFDLRFDGEHPPTRLEYNADTPTAGEKMDFLANSIKGVAPFLAYFVAAALLLAAFLAIYGRITPYAEFVLIRQGNSAAAISLSGAMLGCALPLASAIAHSAAQGNGDVRRDRPDRAIAGLSGCAPRVAGPRAMHTRRQSGSRNFSRRAVARRGGY